MKDYIEERAVEIANYIIENSATVRQTAKQFRISKSTVHKDVTERLRQINPSLAREARKVLDTNKSERHIRGGMATREKYLHQHGLRTSRSVTSGAGWPRERNIYISMGKGIWSSGTKKCAG